MQALRKSDPIHFAELYIREWRHLDGSSETESITEPSLRVQKGAGGEPWVVFTPRDRFGLALSGGGIRSATFNLGLTQALAQLGVLKEVDYLSTVSGGGYIGGFWMAWLWRNRRRTFGEEHFPVGNDQDGGERAEVRHLREFSRFLLPRVGVMQTELWAIAMTVLGGLIPSLLTAIAMLFLAWSVWIAIAGMLLLAHPCGAIALGSALAAYLLVSQLLWIISRKSEPNWVALIGYIAGSTVGTALMVAASWFWPQILERLPANVGDAVKGIAGEFFPTLLLGAGTLVLLFGRVVLARFFRSRIFVALLEGFERTLTRFLGLTVSLFFLAALWWIAGKMGKFSVPFTAGGAIGSAALFAWAKKWLLSPVEETHGSNLLRTLINHLKRATPKVLAGLAFFLLFLLVGAAVHALGVSPDKFTSVEHQRLVIVAGTIVLLALLLFDPARVGMHEFYRTRISRCYLGASNLPNEKKKEFERAAANRQIIERRNDDLYLVDLAKVTKPVHLICTAANDISGDSLGTLYRGAKSAVLSANGISIGDDTAPLNELRVSAALTASAAAFNSQMGRLSIDLGPAVTFLMSALNLRLGLWVPHPRNRFRGNYLLPGRFFLYELLGHSRANARNLHLSDGNHFENLGLYELIRRHTRYIIVSDCGADPEVAFDDLANVLRRVREDFGVEIEIDVRSLRPSENGLAKQHAVVGTIHYNGLTGMDKGTILYFKPTLTGDEPPDVLQYHTRNRAFPHESTGDQFYDEPQWESYRRLGEHAARMVLGFFERPDPKISNRVDKLFRDARGQWHPAPDRQEEGFLQMTERCASLEADLLAHGPHHLRAEVFSEVTELAGTNLSNPKPDEEMAIFSYLLRAMQIMEDVWLCADLERYWSHPLNEGWMSYFHRWASTSSFRRWWPILAPIYSQGFREFAKERFSVGVHDKFARPDSERSITAGKLTLGVVDDRKKFMTGHTWQCFQQSHSDFGIPADAVLFSYELEMLGYDGKPGDKRLPIGFAIVREEPCQESGKVSAAGVDQGNWTAVWEANQLFVPRALQGSGMLARLLDALVRHYEKGDSQPGRKFVQLEVHFAPEQGLSATQKPAMKPKVLSQAARYQRVQDIEFFKSRGFHYVEAEDAQTGKITLVRSLAQ